MVFDVEMSHRVLVVDDEQDVARLISFNLERAGFETQVAGTGGDALLMAARQPPTVIVLDLMLPDSSGIDVCRRLRGDATLGGVGILMLTALGDQKSRITGLEAGADDYVVKPFDVREIVLRVSALARRVGERRHARAQPPSSRLVCGSVSVDPVTHDVQLGGHPVELRPLEFKLLVTLFGEPGKVFTREELLQRVWELDGATANPRTVDVHVRRLRQNLGEHADVVETVSGFGYRARK
jgi:two-component system phosphate regulon response regulator PhoB